MSMLPSIKIYKNSRKEVIIECSWPLIGVAQKNFKNLFRRKNIYAVVGIFGVALGISVSISLFSSQTSLYAETVHTTDPKLPIKRIIFPSYGKTFIFHDTSQQVEIENKLIVLFEFSSMPASILEKVQSGDELMVLRSNNGVYPYTVSEVRTIEKEDLTAFFEDKKASVILYVPENMFKQSYRVYVASE